MQRFISVFGRSLISKSLQHRCGVAVNSVPFHGNFNVRYLTQSIKDHKRPNGVSRRKTFNIHDLLGHIHSGKLFYLKQLTNVFHTIEFGQLKSNEAILLLKCCGSVVPDSSREQRNIVCQDIFTGLQTVNNLNTEIFNRYMKTCTENGVLVYNKELLLKCEPNKDTYKLLLENVCQIGNIEDAFQILETMKNKQIPLDNDTINSLILAHTLTGGLKGAEAVLSTIRTAQILENNTIKLALFKGLIRRKNLDEFRRAVNDYHITLTEEELLEFIEELGLNGLESWLSEALQFYKHISITRDIQNKIEKICIHLIHMKQPVSAMNMYEEFVEPSPEVAYGFPLLKEMLHVNTDINIIISIAKSLVEKELNLYILENLTELALKFRYENQAWTLLKNLETVRPHYFWPLLIHYGQSYGENGIISVLTRTKEFKVKLDEETLRFYVIPYCDLFNSKLLMLKLQEIGFNVREILSPMLTVLLSQKKTKKASELCRLYNVYISGEDFLQLLARSWAFTKDTTSVLTLLARYCESDKLGKDLVGSFLIHTANLCESKDFEAYLNLIRVIGQNRLRISSHMADVLQNISKSFTKSESEKELQLSLHSLVDFGLNMAEEPVIPHPKTMDLDGLECHLIELQEKNMETRGVLRRLIQMHASKGNVDRAKELRQLFLESGYEETPGIKSSIMHSYVLGEHLEEATRLYEELKRGHPEFHLDSFKIIDLVTLLINHNRFEKGYAILQDQISNGSKMNNFRSLERNCKDLLNACKNAEQVDMIFNLLSQSGVLKVSNVILGPLVRIHLKSGDIDKAVERYIELSKKHKCTPLQFEVLCAVAKRQNADQLEHVLRATEAVHGPGPAQVGLIAALAENGQENALKKNLITISSPIRNLLQARCRRWVEERKINPLLCLAKACCRISQKVVNIDFVQKCILDIYDLNGDCDGALTHFENLPEELRSIELDQEVQKIRNKYKVSAVSTKIANTL